METVVVMLSTYNGENFLKEQIDSILGQEKVKVILQIRDDGSSDNTINIIQQYLDNENVNLVVGTNIGWRRSFMTLVKNVTNSSNYYYAFADQDDIWKSDKLFQAVTKMDKERPTLYHSNVSVVDENMCFIGNRFSNNFKPTTQKKEAFLNGFGVGSTMVFNSKMLSIVQNYIPEEETNHDAYIMALAIFFGTIVYDKESYILYRRHSNTATGFGKIKNAAKPSLIARYKRYKKNPKHGFSNRAGIIINGFSNQLTKSDLKFLKKISEYRSNRLDRISLILDPNIRATGLRKTLQVKYRLIVKSL